MQSQQQFSPVALCMPEQTMCHLVFNILEMCASAEIKHQ